MAGGASTAVIAADTRGTGRRRSSSPSGEQASLEMQAQYLLQYYPTYYGQFYQQLVAKQEIEAAVAAAARAASRAAEAEARAAARAAECAARTAEAAALPVLEPGGGVDALGTAGLLDDAAAPVAPMSGSSSLTQTQEGVQGAGVADCGWRNAPAQVVMQAAGLAAPGRVPIRPIAVAAPAYTSVPEMRAALGAGVSSTAGPSWVPPSVPLRLTTGVLTIGALGPSSPPLRVEGVVGQPSITIVGRGRGEPLGAQLQVGATVWNADAWTAISDDWGASCGGWNIDDGSGDMSPQVASGSGGVQSSQANPRNSDDPLVLFHRGQSVALGADSSGIDGSLWEGNCGGDLGNAEDNAWGGDDWWSSGYGAHDLYGGSVYKRPRSIGQL